MKPAAVAVLALAVLAPLSSEGPAQYADGAGRLRVALVKQPFVPNGASSGPTTMASGGIQEALRQMGATVRGLSARATPIIPRRF